MLDHVFQTTRQILWWNNIYRQTLWLADNFQLFIICCIHKNALNKIFILRYTFKMCQSSSLFSRLLHLLHSLAIAVIQNTRLLQLNNKSVFYCTQKYIHPWETLEHKLIPGIFLVCEHQCVIPRWKKPLIASECYTGLKGLFYQKKSISFQRGRRLGIWKSLHSCNLSCCLNKCWFSWVKFSGKQYCVCLFPRS